MSGNVLLQAEGEWPVFADDVVGGTEPPKLNLPQQREGATTHKELKSVGPVAPFYVDDPTHAGSS